MNRLYSLDYLRGLAATSIMIFHYIGWHYGHLDSASFLGRMGIYGVSIFYILSGLTLFTVYFERMEFRSDQLKDFFIKRVARIFPLFWLVTVLVIAIDRGPMDAWTLFINFTGLFGLVDWDAGIAIGIWSIGNELVFYLFFPVFVLLAKKMETTFFVFAALITFLYLFFAFRILTPEQKLADQWANYVNPLNQVFLFLAGFIIGYARGFTKHRGLNLTLLAISFFVFVFFPSTGDLIGIVTGWNRLIFSLCSIGICMAFYNLNFHMKNGMGKILSFLGESSYSIYLFHPIVWTIIYSVLKRLALYFSFPGEFQIIFSVITTFIVSSIVYNRFEKFFMKKGKSLTIKLNVERTS